MQAYNSGNMEKYNSRNPIKKGLVERLNRKIISILGEMIGENNATVLDAGCGEGYISRLIASSFPNVNVTGIEYTPEAINVAKEMDTLVSYIQGDISDMPFENHSFDFVVCTEVLEHVENPDKALSELLRVGKNGVLITVPHEPWFRMGNMLAFKNVSRFGNPIDHINHWSFRSFKRFVCRYSRNAEFSNSFPWSVAKIQLGKEVLQ